MAGIMDPIDGSLAPEIQAYAFGKLQDFADELATERLGIYRRQRVGPFSVTSGMGDITATSPITIGSGATWNTARPVYIDGAAVIYTAGSTPRPELPMQVFTVDEWRDIVVKGITSTLSRALIYDRLYNSSGYGNIYLYPVPSASFQVVLYVPVAVTEFPLDASNNLDLTTVLALPPGYRSMLVSNLAVILSIGLIPVSDDLRERAVNSMAKVKASNVVTHMDTLSCDAATLGRNENATGFDWLTGGISA